MLDKISFTEDQIALIKNQVAPGATNDELNLFLYQAKRTGLDPLAKQIYFIKRRQKVKKNMNGVWTETYEDKISIQVGIGGFESIAERSGEYEGQTKPEWCGEDGKWMDVWLKPTPPAAARVGVWRKGFKEAVYGVARFSSYAQVNEKNEPLALWKKMPDVMLAKVAEALALRKAFPQDLSGLYTTEEMEQAGLAPTAPAETTTAPKDNLFQEGEVVTDPKPTSPAPPAPATPADPIMEVTAGMGGQADIAKGSAEEFQNWTEEQDARIEAERQKQAAEKQKGSGVVVTATTGEPGNGNAQVAPSGVEPEDPSIPVATKEGSGEPAGAGQVETPAATSSATPEDKAPATATQKQLLTSLAQANKITKTAEEIEKISFTEARDLITKSRNK